MGYVVKLGEPRPGGRPGGRGKEPPAGGGLPLPRLAVGMLLALLLVGLIWGVAAISRDSTAPVPESTAAGEVLDDQATAGDAAAGDAAAGSGEVLDDQKAAE